MIGQRRLSRRTLLRSLAFTAGAALVAGCSKSPSQSLSQTLAPSRSVKVTFGWPFTGQDTDKWGKVLKDLVAQKPAWPAGVELADSPIAGNYQQMLTSAIAAGTAPDLWLQEDMLLYDIARQGQLLLLDPLVSADTGFNLKDFPAQQVDLARYKQKLYALPFYSSSSFLCINRALFDAQGIQVPKGDWRWDEFKAVARTLTSATDRRWGFGAPDEWHYLCERVWQNGGNVFDAERTRCLLDQPAALEALKYWADMLRDQTMSNPETARANNYRLFGDGRVAMFETTVEDVVRRKFDELKFNWQFVELPYQQRKVSTVFVTYLVVNAKTPHPREAWLAMMNLLGPERLTSLAGTLHTPVGRTSVNQKKPFAYTGLNVSWDLVAQGAQNGRPIDGVPSPYEIYNLVGEMLTKYFAGEASERDVSDYVQRINALLAK